VVDSSHFSDDKLLNVIIASAQDTTGTTAQRAFVFAEGKFRGYDTKDPSAMIAVTSSAYSKMMLRYGLFDPGDDTCCPRDFADVGFYWNGTSLVPDGPFPPSDPAVHGSRR
jgi:hypothetical protein